MSLFDLDFTEVKPGTLASCLNKLEDIAFGDCAFSKDLGDEVFKMMAEASKLKRIKLLGHGQLNVEAVSQQLVSQCSFNRMEQVCILNALTRNKLLKY